jgi:hypothetical protein
MGDDAITAYDYDEDNLYIYTRMMEYRGVDGYFDEFTWNGHDRIVLSYTPPTPGPSVPTGMGIVTIPLSELGAVTAPFFLYPVDVQITLSSGDHIPLPDLYFWIENGPPVTPTPTPNHDLPETPAA